LSVMLRGHHIQELCFLLWTSQKEEHRMATGEETGVRPCSIVNVGWPALLLQYMRWGCPVI
jgi:hypothetical protein